MGLRFVRAWVGVGWTSAVCGLTFCSRACAYVRAYVCACVRAVYPMVARARMRAFIFARCGAGLEAGWFTRNPLIIKGFVILCVNCVNVYRGACHCNALNLGRCVNCVNCVIYYWDTQIIENDQGRTSRVRGAII